MMTMTMTMMMTMTMTMMMQGHERERNYTICYIAFTTFMICTMVVATKLPFHYPEVDATPGVTATAPNLSPNMVRILNSTSFLLFHLSSVVGVVGSYLV